MKRIPLLTCIVTVATWAALAGGVSADDPPTAKPPREPNVVIINDAGRLTADRLVIGRRHAARRDNENSTAEAPGQRPAWQTKEASPNVAFSEAPALPKALDRIEVEIQLLTLDWKKLDAAGIDLPKTIGRLATRVDRLKSHRPPGVPARAAGPTPPTLLSTFTSASAEKLVQSLKTSRAASVVFEPTVRTVGGRTATVKNVLQTPVEVLITNANGREVREIRILELGNTVQITPSVLEAAKVRLELSARHSRLDADADRAPGSRTTADLPSKSREMKFSAELQSGQTLVFADAGPIKSTPGAPAEPGLMLVVTPKLLKVVSAPEAVRRSDREGEEHRPEAAPVPREPRKAPPAPLIHPIECGITFLTIDWKKLDTSGIDLAEKIRELSPRTEASSARGKPVTLQNTCAPAAAEELVALLKTSQAAKVVFAPRVRTFDGREASVSTKTQRPMVVLRATANGRKRDRVMILEHGPMVRLTPGVGPDDEIQLRVVAEQSRLVPDPEAGDRGRTISDFVLRSRELETIAMVQSGRTLVLADAGPIKSTPDADAEPGLMLVVTPKVLKAVPASETVPLSDRHDDEHGPHSAPDLPEPLNAVRELRREVRAMRRDVDRLIEVLEAHENKEVTAGAATKTTSAAAKQRLLKKLDAPVSLDFKEQPLDEAVRHIAATASVNIVIDKRALEEEGVTTKQPVTLHLDGVSLGKALDFLLDPLHLACKTTDDALIITSGQRAQGPLQVRVYPVADLLDLPANKAADDPEVLDAKFKSLMKLIVAAVQPESWSEVGGGGSIRTFEKGMSLVIRQTRHAHEEIVEILHQLRRLQDLQVGLQSHLASPVSETLWSKLETNENTGPALKRLAENGRHAVLTRKEAFALLKSLQSSEATNLMQLPKTTLFNGRPGRFWGTLPSAGLAMGEESRPFSYRPVVSADRRTIRLAVAAGEDPLAEANIPDAGTLLIDMTDRLTRDAEVGVPIAGRERSFQKVRGANERVLLLVTPSIVVQEEEEEELLGIEPRSR